jgi:hypothetical protein
MIQFTYDTVREDNKIVVYETGEGIPRNGNFQNRYEFKTLLQARQKIKEWTQVAKDKFGKKVIITWVESPQL